MNLREQYKIIKTKAVHDPLNGISVKPHYFWNLYFKSLPSMILYYMEDINAKSLSFIYVRTGLETL